MSPSYAYRRTNAAEGHRYLPLPIYERAVYPSAASSQASGGYASLLPSPSTTLVDITPGGEDESEYFHFQPVETIIEGIRRRVGDDRSAFKRFFLHLLTYAYYGVLWATLCAFIGTVYYAWIREEPPYTSLGVFDWLIPSVLGGWIMGLVCSAVYLAASTAIQRAAHVRWGVISEEITITALGEPQVLDRHWPITDFTENVLFALLGGVVGVSGQCFGVVVLTDRIAPPYTAWDAVKSSATGITPMVVVGGIVLLEQTGVLRYVCCPCDHLDEMD